MKHNKELLVKIGDKLRIYREFKKLSQENMAQELDIAQKTYCNIENGISDVSISILYKIAEILGVTVKNILDEVDDNFLQNIFNNNNGNKGVNIMTQNVDRKENIKELQNELILSLKSENEALKKMIKLLEKNN